MSTLPIVSDMMLRVLERDLPVAPPSAKPPAAIVLLGADISGAGYDMAGAHLGFLSLERVREAAILARETHLPILVSGGTMRTDRAPVADLMADSLEHTFDVKPTWIEHGSRDTWENAQRSAEMLRAQGITSVYVVTHGWHMRRALIAFAHTGITITAVPVSPTPEFELTAAGFVPDIRGWDDSYYAVHEWIGCIWYALR